MCLSASLTLQLEGIDVFVQTTEVSQSVLVTISHGGQSRLPCLVVVFVKYAPLHFSLQ